MILYPAILKRLFLSLDATAIAISEISGSDCPSWAYMKAAYGLSPHATKTLAVMGDLLHFAVGPPITDAVSMWSKGVGVSKPKLSQSATRHSSYSHFLYDNGGGSTACSAAFAWTKIHVKTLAYLANHKLHNI